MDKRMPLSLEYPLSKKKILKKVLCKIPLLFLLSFLTSFTLYIGTYYFAYMNNMEVLGGFSILLYPITLILFPIVATVLSFFYYKKYINSYFYDISGQHLTIKKGVWSSHEAHILLSSVSDITLDQDFFDKLFGLYNIHFITEGGFGQDIAHIDGIPLTGANKIKGIVLGTTSQAHFISKKSSVIKGSEGAVHIYMVSPLWLLKRFFHGALFSCIPVLIVWLGVFWPAKVYTPTLFQTFEPSFSQTTLLTNVYFMSLLVFMLLALFKKLFTSYLFKKLYVETTVMSFTGSKEEHLLYSSIKKATLTQSALDTALGLADIELNQNWSTDELSENISEKKPLTLFGLSKTDARIIMHNLEKKSIPVSS